MVFCLFMSMVNQRRRKSKEKKLAKKQHIKDPVLFCLDLLQRQGKDKEEALNYAAEVFRPDHIVYAKYKLMRVMGKRPLPDLPDDKDGETAGQLATLGTYEAAKEWNLKELREISDAMLELEKHRLDKFRHLTYSTATVDVHYFLAAENDDAGAMMAQ